MKTLTDCCKLTLVSALFAAGSVAMAASMSHAEYSAKKDQISADYKADKAACDKLDGNTKDVCVEKAKAKEKIAKAELEFNYTGKAADGNKIAVVKADANYDVAKEMCDDKKGDDKDACVKEAKATHARALADAKKSS